MATSAFLSPANKALADESSSSSLAPKVLVLGGTGMVGKEVVRQLREKDINVVATSRDGRDGTAALDFAAVGSDIDATVSRLSEGCSAIISCVGSIGTDMDGLVNSGSGKVAQSAPSSVKKFVYISVAPEVREASKGVSFLKDYMEGKSYSEAAIQSAFGSGGRSYTLIKPTFIYGGDEFKVNPPRVATGYGKLVEGLLSTSVFRAAAGVLPGIIGIALEPPVFVEAVAGAAVSAALGSNNVGNVLDTHDEIVDASGV
mmetsp:Transcript_23393/g.36051  ORF Transcript_23393/g.36051 Transcript_23393/m.36051 type:complete len:258 (+) Transcript_23393:3-776(+)